MIKKLSKKKVIEICLVTAIMLCLCGLLIFFLAVPSHNDVIMIGHRGYSSKYLENTENAFIQAALHGSEGVETDVRYTKDGVYVLSHGSDAVFADGTTAVISESNFDDIKNKPLKNDINNDVAYICTLQRYLEICKQYNMICFIELKGDYTNEQIYDVFTYVQNYYTLDMVELQSFNFDILVEAQKMFPNLRFMLTWDQESGDYSKCFDYGFDIDAYCYSLSQKLVKEFHKRGLKVATWTCNDIFALHYAYWFDVDYIESDVF